MNTKMTSALLGSLILVLAPAAASAAQHAHLTDKELLAKLREAAPPNVLAGATVLLRVLRPSDASAWHAGEDEEQRRWFEFPGPAPYATVVAAIDAWRASWRSGGAVRHWGIWTDDGATLAGGVEVRDRGDQRANISYVVFPHARRRGLAAAAVVLAAEWAFEHLPVDAVVAVIDPRNQASLGVARRAGFVADGVAEAWEYSETGPMLRFVLTRPERSSYT